MDIVYARGEASAADVHAALPDPPSYSAVRALLAILVDKGHLKHRAEQGKYIYTPTRRRAHVGRSALRRVLDTFFEGSLEKAVAALLQPLGRVVAGGLTPAAILAVVRPFVGPSQCAFF